MKPVKPLVKVTREDVQDKELVKHFTDRIKNSCKMLCDEGMTFTGYGLVMFYEKRSMMNPNNYDFISKTSVSLGIAPEKVFSDGIKELNRNGMRCFGRQAPKERT